MSSYSFFNNCFLFLFIPYLPLTEVIKYAFLLSAISLILDNCVKIGSIMILPFEVVYPYLYPLSVFVLIINPSFLYPSLSL